MLRFVGFVPGFWVCRQIDMAKAVSPALNCASLGFFLEHAVQVDIDSTMDYWLANRPSALPPVALSVFYLRLVTDDAREKLGQTLRHLRAAREKENEQ